MDSLAGRGPELVLWDQLQRKASSERPRIPSAANREGVIEEAGGPEPVAMAPSSEGQGLESLPGPVLSRGKGGKVCFLTRLLVHLK